MLVDVSLFAGADGAVPGLANVDPHAHVALYDAARRQDWSRASSSRGG